MQHTQLQIPNLVNGFTNPQIVQIPTFPQIEKQNIVPNITNDTISIFGQIIAKKYFYLFLICFFIIISYFIWIWWNKEEIDDDDVDDDNIKLDDINAHNQNQQMMMQQHLIQQMNKDNINKQN